MEFLLPPSPPQRKRIKKRRRKRIECSCNDSVCVTSYKDQIGGVWNPMKDAGMIAGHGEIWTDRFVVIPEGFRIRPLAPLGQVFNANELKEHLDELSTKDVRKMAFDSDVYDDSYGHVYSAGDVIPNMRIHFRLLWEKNKDNPKIPEGKYLYNVTGVVTERKIDVNFGMDDMRKVNTIIKTDAMASHDDSIKIEWGAKMSLGQIIREISEANKEGDYWLMACRKGDLVNAEQDCGDEKLKKTLRSSQTILFKSFADKVEHLNSSPEKYGTTLGILKDNKPLLEEFVRIYAVFVKSKISKENDYTIDSKLLCEVNEIAQKKYITLQTVKRTEENTLFLNWWTKFNAYRRKVANQQKRKAPSEPTKQKRKSEGFAFKF